MDYQKCEHCGEVTNRIKSHMKNAHPNEDASAFTSLLANFIPEYRALIKVPLNSQLLDEWLMALN